MKNEIDVKKIGLPKWPGFIVTGKAVTKEQAMEIIIRTTGMCFSSNDRQFEKLLYNFLGIKVDKDSYFRPEWEDVEKIETELGSIRVKNNNTGGDITRIEYCDNHRVLSCWIGGPHGWIDWNGKVGCDNYNIGKWPNAEVVQAEWKAIAKAFPYLDLKCQLLSGETCEDNLFPVIQYNISKGKVKVVKPTKMIDQPEAGLGDDCNIFAPGRERGCTLQQFKDAVNLVREKK